MCLYFVFKLHTLYIYNTDICTHSMQTYLLEIAYILSRYPYIFLFSCQYLSISMFAEYCAFCYIWIKIIGRIWFVCVNYSVYYLLVCLLRWICVLFCLKASMKSWQLRRDWWKELVSSVENETPLDDICSSAFFSWVLKL